MSQFSLKKKSVLPENIRPVSREDAISQLMIFLEYYHVDLDEMVTRASENKKIAKNEEIADMLDSETMGLEMCRPIEQGWLTIADENATPVLTLHLFNPVGEIKEIKFGAVTGKVRRAVAGGNEKRRGFDFASECCYETKQLLDKLKGVDGQHFEIVANAFFTMV